MMWQVRELVTLDIIYALNVLAVILVQGKCRGYVGTYAKTRS
jgi:hypothetical protein